MPEKPRVLLIQPPIYDFALYDHFLKPYGLLRVGRWLKNAGWEVRLLNCLDYQDGASEEALGPVIRKPDGMGKFFRQPQALPPVEKKIRRQYSRYGILSSVITSRLKAWEPDLALITTGMTYWYPGVRETAGLLKEIYPRLPLAAGGIYASLMPEHCRDSCGVDKVFVRRGWDEMAAFFSGLGFPPVKAPGGSGGTVRPLPLGEVWRGAGVIRLNEGCPLNCDYCASRAVSGGFCQGSPEAAWEAVKELHDSAGVKNFAFYDDALLYKKDAVFLPFLEKIIASGLELNFYTPNGVHLNYLDGETARLMLRAGFKEIRLGFESSSEDFHQIHDGKWAGGDFVRTFETLLAAGFRRDQIRVYILAGLPGQLASEVETSIRHVKSREIRISIAEFSPVPGSPLWEECVRRSGLPLETEPLYHNNCFFPLEWEGFRQEDLARLKRLCRGG